MIFDLASVTKPMTAVAVVRAGLDLDAPLASYLPEVAGTFAGGATLELLLAHRAGLDAHRLFGEFGPPPDAPRARGDVLREAAEARRPDVEPPLPAAGAPPVYSDLGYLLVGEALARRLGARDAGEVIDDLVVRALDDATLGTARALSARDLDFDGRVVPTEVVPARGGEVRGVVHDENAFWLTGRGGSGHAGMFGTIDGLLAFGQAVHDGVVFGGGPLVDGATTRDGLARLVRPRPGGTLRAGFDGKSGEGSSAGTLHGADTFGHLGFTGTSLWIDPRAGVVTALLTNRVHPTRDNQALRAVRPRAHDALFLMARTARVLP